MLIMMIGTYELFATWLRARLGAPDRGSSVVEYALLVALVAVACIVAIRSLSEESRTSFSRSGSALPG